MSLFVFKFVFKLFMIQFRTTSVTLCTPLFYFQNTSSIYLRYVLLVTLSEVFWSPTRDFTLTLDLYRSGKEGNYVTWYGLTEYIQALRRFMVTMSLLILSGTKTEDLKFKVNSYVC